MFDCHHVYITCICALQGAILADFLQIWFKHLFMQYKIMTWTSLPPNFWFLGPLGVVLEILPLFPFKMVKQSFTKIVNPFVFDSSLFGSIFKVQ